MKGLFAKAHGLFHAMVLGMLLSFAAVPAFAVIDVAGATTAISDGTTAVTTIITALLVAYGTFLGLRMALRATKRGG